MIQYTKGDSSILAEIIIDYEKKDVQILDPENRFEVKNKDLNFKPHFVLVNAFTIFSIIFAIIVYASRFDIPTIEWIIIPYEILFMFYLIQVLLTPLNKKLAKFWQFITNDFFLVKKFMVVKNINAKEWRLPYPFENIKFDCDMYGDYKKFIKKIHIKPKDYFWVRRKKKEKQIEEWEAVFYFTKTPRTGKMCITWI